MTTINVHVVGGYSLNYNNTPKATRSFESYVRMHRNFPVYGALSADIV